jgi:acetyl esterase/lipase
MDDGIIMAQRLKSLKQPVTLTVMDELSHGFLNLAGTELIKGATSNCLTLMKNALK